MTVVTISRGTYTGGIAVAERLAEQLQYPCVSREIVIEAAQESGIPEDRLYRTLEEPPHFWEQTPGRVAAHLNLVRAALLKRASRGDLVYHGYAGHFLLDGIPHVLRARIIADRDSRVRAAMKDKDMSYKAAAQFVAHLDDQLRKWTRFLYGVEWQDPALYDVVLNLDHISVNGAVETLVAMTRLDDLAPVDGARKALDDLLLSSVVWAALTKDPRTGSAAVQVTADDGVVFITGSAKNAQVMAAVQEIAARLDGVAEVRSEVGVGRHWQW